MKKFKIKDDRIVMIPTITGLIFCFIDLPKDAMTSSFVSYIEGEAIRKCMSDEK